MSKLVKTGLDVYIDPRDTLSLVSTTATATTTLSDLSGNGNDVTLVGGAGVGDAINDGVWLEGGKVSVANGFRIHTFTDVGAHRVRVVRGGTCEVLVVAGGGGGGSAAGTSGGGGGAGGVVRRKIRVQTGTETVTVGTGGVASSASNIASQSGQNSSIGNNVVAIGGGAGGSSYTNITFDPATGGSGGGGSAQNLDRTRNGANGTTDQGFAGGNGFGDDAVVDPQAAGGGGGAGGAGENAVASTAGNGGIGVQSDISGVLTFYGGGGGGGKRSSTGSAGVGGQGGGGNGGQNANGQHAQPNTGGGGGGTGGHLSSGFRNGGNGGSGIVIVRYPISTSSVAFQGFPQRIETTYNPNLDGTTEYTWEAWYKSTAEGAKLTREGGGGVTEGASTALVSNYGRRGAVALPTTWTQRVTNNFNWEDVIWVKELGLFIAVAQNGGTEGIMTSPDGITWTTRTKDNLGSLYDIVWAPELQLMVAIGNSFVATSTDGISWTTYSVDNPCTLEGSSSNNSWRALTWSPELNLFVAVAMGGVGNRVMTSPNGITWTTRVSAADNNWFGITWSPELSIFVVVSNTGTGNRIMTSPDGIHWLTRQSPVDNSWQNVAWSPKLGIFAATSTDGGTNRVMTSYDGITWVTRTTTTNWWNRIRWVADLGLFVAVGINVVMYSADGITWTRIATGISDVWWGFDWSPELSRFVAVAAYGTTFPPDRWAVPTTAYSKLHITDRGHAYIAEKSSVGEVGVAGIDWVTRASAADNEWWSVVWARELGLFVAVGQSNTNNGIMTSPDGVVWTTRPMPTSYIWTSTAWSPELNRFVSVADNPNVSNNIMTSIDGITWETLSVGFERTWLSIVWSPEKSLFVAVGYNGAGYSPNGLSWTSSATPPGNWRALVWAKELSLFIAVSFSEANGTVIISEDGINWVSYTSASNNAWRGLTWSSELGILVAVASSGTGNRVMTSHNGINWVSREAPDSFWRSVVYAPELSLFVAVSEQGNNIRIMTSPNGIQWTTRQHPELLRYRSICWSPELTRFVAVASSGSGVGASVDTGNRVMTSGGSPGTAFHVDTTRSLADGAWHHVVKSVDTANQRLYIDGDLVTTILRPPGGGGTSNIVIGAGHVGRYPTTASIGAVRLYRGKALSDAEVARHYAAELPLYNTGIRTEGLEVHLSPLNPSSYPGRGRRILDLSGNGNHALLEGGASFAQNAFVLGGEGQYLSTTYKPNLDNGTDFTWELWFWDDSPGLTIGSSTALIGNCMTLTTPFVQLVITDSGTVRWTLRNSANESEAFTTQQTITDGVWHHVVAVGTSTQQNLYIDGELIDSRARVSGVVTSTQNIIIGGNHLGRFQTCRIGSVRLYRGVALSATDIQRHFLLERPFFGQSRVTGPTQRGRTRGNPADVVRRIQGAQASGVYWLRPKGFAREAFPVYIDFDNDGGAWVLIAKYGSNDKTLDKLFAKAAVDTSAEGNAILTPEFSGSATYARLSRDQMNALWGVSNHVVRAHYKRVNDTRAGVYFQRKITNTDTFDLWHGLANSSLWSDGATEVVSGTPVATHGGIRWEGSFAWANTDPSVANYNATVTNSPFYNTVTHTVNFNGTPRFTTSNGYGMINGGITTQTIPANGNEPITYNTGMGLFVGITTTDQQMMNASPSDSLFETDQNRQTILFLRCDTSQFTLEQPPIGALRASTLAVAQPLAAWSLRHLMPEYAGPMLRVRRGSDSRAAHVWFGSRGDVRKAQDLVTERFVYGNRGFQQWLGGAQAFVEVWYDQSGNALHGVAESVETQPLLTTFRTGGGWALSQEDDDGQARYLVLKPDGGVLATNPANFGAFSVAQLGYGSQPTTVRPYLQVGEDNAVNIELIATTTGLEFDNDPPSGTNTPSTPLAIGTDTHIASWTRSSSGNVITYAFPPNRTASIDYETYTGGALVETTTGYRRGNTPRQQFNTSRYSELVLYDSDVSSIANELQRSMQRFSNPRRALAPAQRVATEPTALDVLTPTSKAACKAAFSLRLVNRDYTGPVVKVRRSTDGVLGEFYASPAGRLGDAPLGTGQTLEAWLGEPGEFYREKIPDTWVTRNAFDSAWNDVVWSSELGLFVAVASDTTTSERIMTSNDGILWQTRVAPNNLSWRAVVWAKEIGRFVAVSSDGSGNRAMTSDNGLTWVSRSTPNNAWWAVTWSASRSLFVAVASTTETSGVMTSPDGITWTSRISAEALNWRSVTWSPELGLFVATAITGTGNRVMTSTNGIDWVTQASAADDAWQSVDWASELGLFAAVSGQGTVMTSSNGIQWVTQESGTTNAFREIRWFSELGLFVAVGTSGAGNRVITSPDGIVWTTRASGGDFDWFGVAWSPELRRLVAVAITGGGDGVMTSDVPYATAFVDTWYDQSGNGNHATQSDAALQPYITRSGATTSEIPVVYFNGGQHLPFQEAGTGSILHETDYSVVTFERRQSGQVNVYMMGHLYPSGSRGSQYGYRASNTLRIWHYGNNLLQFSSVPIFNPTDEPYRSSTFIHSSSTGKTIAVDGTIVATNSQVVPLSNPGILTIGAAVGPGVGVPAGFYIGELPEILVFNTDLPTPDITAVYNNQVAYAAPVTNTALAGQFANSVGAFGLRRVVPTWVRAVVRVRRGSDDALRNFYANRAGRLGDAVGGRGRSLEDWLAGAPGYVQTWFDQTGKGDAWQYTNADQPLIVREVGGGYAVQFTGGSVGLEMTGKAGVLSIVTHVKFRTKTSSGFQSIVRFGTGGGFRTVFRDIYGDAFLYPPTRFTGDFLAPTNSYWYINNQPGNMTGQRAEDADLPTSFTGIRQHANGAWQHLVAVRDRSPMTAFTHIGSARAGFTERSMEGLMSELLLFTTKLDASEATTLYNLRPPLLTTDTRTVFSKLSSTARATCQAAYSVRLVNPDYFGAVFQIRRGSDNATLDFFADPDGSKVGTAYLGNGESLVAWLGGATGHVEIWYDQSGKGRNATQTTQALQPLIAFNTVIGVYEVSGEENELVTTYTVPSVKDWFMTCRPITAGGSELIGLNTGAMIDFGTFTSLNRHRIRNGDNSIYQQGFQYDTYLTFEAAYTGSDTLIYLPHPKNTLITYKDNDAFAWSGSALRIMGTDFTGRRFKGRAHEFLLFDAILPQADRVVLRKEMPRLVRTL
jgi:hypothetical protein